ncbi:MAG: dolichyl-phosphate-mannose--protein mannosyltransferase [Thermoplasmata archaeon]
MINFKKYKNLRSYVLLIVITLLGILLRILPSYRYSIWGVDFGIYYALTTAFVNLGLIFNSLPSIWGSSGYGNFPMFYWTMVLIHDLTGFSVNMLLLRVPPIFAGFTIPIIYFISKKITKSDAIGILSALFLAINPLEIFETSMVGLLVFGHLFLLLSILLFLYSRDNIKFYFPLIFSSIALIFSHHLSTYMYILSIFGIIYITKIVNNSYKNYYLEVIYLITFISGTFAYWFIKVPSMYAFMEQAFLGIFPWYIVVMIFYILVFLLFFMSKYIRKIVEKISIKEIEMKDSFTFFLTLFLVFTIFILLATIGIKGIKITYLGLVYSIPFILTIGLIGIGINRIKKYYNAKIIILGWIFFLSISLLYSTITWNGVLIPYRYLEYLFEPFSILAGIGFYEIYNYKTTHQPKDERKYYYLPPESFIKAPVISQEIRTSAPMMFFNERNFKKLVQVENTDLKSIFLIFLIIFVMISLVTAYPFINQVSEVSQNYVTPVMMSGIYWIEKNGNKNYSVATDAVDGLYLEALGFNSSFEYTYYLWNSSNWKDAIYELNGFNGTYPKIGYVLINSNMYYNGVYGYELSTHPSYDPPIYISNSSFEKFFSEPFEKVYYNSTYDNSQWVYVFIVNWTYIEKNG